MTPGDVGPSLPLTFETPPLTPLVHYHWPHPICQPQALLGQPESCQSFAIPRGQLSSTPSALVPSVAAAPTCPPLHGSPSRSPLLFSATSGVQRCWCWLWFEHFDGTTFQQVSLRDIQLLGRLQVTSRHIMVPQFVPRVGGCKLPMSLCSLTSDHSSSLSLPYATVSSKSGAQPFARAALGDSFPS